jgi:PAS domain-containing protein
MEDTNHDARFEQRHQEQAAETKMKLSIRSIPKLSHASSHAELPSLGLLDALRADHRPSFIVDVSPKSKHDGSLDFAYYNPALLVASELVSLIEGRGSLGTISADTLEPYQAFKKWLWGKADETDRARRGQAYLFGEHLWHVTAMEQYRVANGVPIALMSPVLNDNGAGTKTPDYFDAREHMTPKNLPQFAERPPASTPPSAHGSLMTSYGSFDYTLDPPSATMTEHIQYFRSIDWAATPLGAMESWCPKLRCAVNLMMRDQYPAVLFCGDDMTMIYNEAYIELISVMHPCMGHSARVAAKHFWPHFQPIVDHINATGQTVSDCDLPLFLDRHGFLEEAYFSFQFTPIFNTAGHVTNYYQTLTETTKAKLVERRVSNLVEIGSETAKARNLSTYWELVLNTLAINGKDAPFALLYAAEHRDTPGVPCVSSPGSTDTLNHYVLKGSIGVDADHPLAPSIIDIREDSGAFHPYLVKASKTESPVVVHFSELHGPVGLQENIDWRGYGDPCRSFVVCPILPTTCKQVQGFLILGINPRRPFDEDYQQFVHVMLRLMSTSLASVVLFDEEIRQKENAIGQATRIQEQLVTELQLKEKKFQRYADGSDVGIFVIDAAGNYTYRNKSWYNLFDTAVAVDNVMSAWSEFVWPEDVPIAEGLFAKLLVEKIPIEFELRTSMPWTPPEDSIGPNDESRTHYKWIFCSAYPELNADDEIAEIVGNVSDISKQKWAENLQKMRTNSALESKRHLEHFIDTTSHEMRNPLSAIMQYVGHVLSLVYVISDVVGSNV